tara:strand:- start:14 stop:178 length:165 start_codon:yes stop_codon:yes gene_type:complete
MTQQNRNDLNTSMEEFLIKVSEMYQHNLNQYPDEKPTMSGAFVEILEDINRGEY